MVVGRSRPYGRTVIDKTSDFMDRHFTKTSALQMRMKWGAHITTSLHCVTLRRNTMLSC